MATPPDPERFSVSESTLRLDRLMTRFIFTGGLAVLVAIAAIFVFILMEIAPLFRGARVSEEATVALHDGSPLLLGVDEWGELPFVLWADGRIDFVDTVDGAVRQTQLVPLPDGTTIRSATYNQASQTIALGLDDGRVLLGTVAYQAEVSAGGERSVGARLQWDPVQKVFDGLPVVQLSAYAGARRKSVAAVGEGPDGRELVVVSLTQRRSLFGASGFQIDNRTVLHDRVEGLVEEVLVGSNAEILTVRSNRHEVFYFHWTGSSWELRQRFVPFPESGSAIASMHFIQGEVSLSLTAEDGRHVLYSLYHQADFGQRLFGQTKNFAEFPGGARYATNSLRNKTLLLANDAGLSLRFATTADVRWQKQTAVRLQLPVINGKSDRILALADDQTLRIYSLYDPHPQAGFRAFFGKIWYEGQDRPQYIWQSTGGSDSFEPKLSLVPLIVGSLKGTFYALIFVVPIALLAALYTSQFLHPKLRSIIKPTIEIMASLPSVVLGFLGALWLAPILEDRVPSVILLLFSTPLAAVLTGYIWSRLPIRMRIWIPAGYESTFFIPLILLVSTLAWKLGPWWESWFFTYSDPQSGEVIGDFRLWWEAWTGNHFQQRNSMIVGFMMGFAVIPIIFTITDDAMTAVPKSLTSASLALGASRWQTAARIVLPTASAGIFSACMIGFGRAVGETMIVVMATGNTPIMDFDIFSGMRTLSANIAVELPEAPYGGTLYRTLFLGAFVLFVLTFAVNTLAEILRHRLRERYKLN